MFIYDPAKDWTWYLALMSAAQQDGIPVTESVRNDLISEFGWKGDVEPAKSMGKPDRSLRLGACQCDTR